MTERTVETRQSLRFAYAIALAATFAIFLPLGGSVLSTIYLPDARWPHVPVHSVVEGLGGFIALVIAAILVAEVSRDTTHRHYLWMASALAGMGLLDIFHAAVSPGNNFVWLHSTANFIGGIVFAMVWVPLSKRWGYQLPLAVFAAALVFAVGSCLAFSSLPLMAHEGQFTPLARAFNIVGGLGFFTGAAFFLVRCRRHPTGDDWIFAVHCTLFGMAGVLFELSALWDAAWWWWHVLRLLAYVAAVSFAITTYVNNEFRIRWLNKQLTELNASLEERVASRTEELEQRTEELTRSNTELEQFAYVASHDLQEPLRMVRSFCDLLQRRYADKLDGDANTYIEYAVDGAERMSHLVSDLLTFSRVGTTGKPLLPTDATTACQQAITNLQMAIDENDATVTCDPLPTVLADELQLIGLFQNLIGNAVKYRSQESPEIRVHCESNGAESTFCVQDNGIGIEPQYHDKVFVIFKRLHAE